jgi:hypothetical protein
MGGRYKRQPHSFWALGAGRWAVGSGLLGRSLQTPLQLTPTAPLPSESERPSHLPNTERPDSSAYKPQRNRPQHELNSRQFEHPRMNRRRGAGKQA